ncbi:hypothetical protein NA56DRAFT_302391 [Hyaloscypha hepaticicola]|uniref:Uncharacterized protein n=1 Tax=Hyaloscypha hepaticicola TaxID=2082293 RepID=A0A2J6PRZ2_9HELO|nr:hypothetical protein NA56DRAFT_302391 [Hyaloscypha hepaticicola]
MALVTLRDGGGTARGYSDRGCGGGMPPRSGKNKKDQIDKPLLSYTLSLLLNWIVPFCLGTISCGMSHAVLLSFISSHASHVSLLLLPFYLSSPFPYLNFSSLCLAV